MTKNLTPALNPLDRLLDEAIYPNAERIALVCAERDVALVFFELGATTQEVARLMGWGGGNCELHRISRHVAKEVARHFPVANDPSAEFLRRSSRGRILAFMREGTVCLNYSPSEGFSIEPGTVSGDWFSIESIMKDERVNIQPGYRSGDWTN